MSQNQHLHFFGRSRACDGGPAPAVGCHADTGEIGNIITAALFDNGAVTRINLFLCAADRYGGVCDLSLIHISVNSNGTVV